VASVSIHGPTGVLLVDGQKVFPIGLSDPPPHDALARIDHQIATESAIQGTAAAHGLHCWMRLGPAANLPGAAANEQMLQKVVTAFKNHPALCAYNVHGNHATSALPFRIRNA
jgi:hypothetical protein